MAFYSYMIIELLGNLFQPVETAYVEPDRPTGHTISCSAYKPMPDWSYFYVMHKEVFDRRHVFCRVFGIRAYCFNWFVNPRLQQYEEDAMNYYFNTKDSGEIAEFADYTGFLKFLQNKDIQRYYCSTPNEQMVLNTQLDYLSDNLETCPSILRYHLPGGLQIRI